jgi:hypothetical protein
MTDTLLDNLTFLLRYRRAPDKATEAFRHWKHNCDLLPKIQAQLEALLEARGKFRSIVYDTQGIHDDGTDIVINYHKGDEPDDHICFQVKCYDDLAKKDYLKELKAQRDDTFRHFNRLQHYFILLCTDGIAHKSRMREIMAAFRTAEQTEVIEPAFVFTFLHHPKARVEAFVKRAMETDDLVLRLALESLVISSPSARALVIFMTVKSVLTGKRSFIIEELFSEPTLRSIYEELRGQHAALSDSIDDDTGLGEDDAKNGQPEMAGWRSRDYPVQQVADFELQMADDLSLVETDLLEYSADSGEIVLGTNSVRALRAVVSDAFARYDYDESQLISYMFSLAGVRD